MVKKKAKQYLILHGPNLNLLGTREPEVYGVMTLAQLNTKIKKFAKENNLIVRTKQLNSEGALIDELHRANDWADGIVFNPGAYTHYSYALRDAISGIGVTTVEVHLSDIHKREDFRKISVTAPACIAQVSGLGSESYIEGLKILMKEAKK